MKSSPLQGISFTQKKDEMLEESEILLDAFVEKFKNHPTSHNFKRLQRKMFDYQQIQQAKDVTDLDWERIEKDAKVFLNL